MTDPSPVVGGRRISSTPILYFYDPDTKIYTSQRPAQVIPNVLVESASDYPNCTTVAIPDVIPDGQLPVFVPGTAPSWSLQNAHKGPFYLKTTGVRQTQMLILGDLPDTFTTHKPIAMGVWSDSADNWIVDPTQLRPKLITNLNAIYTAKLAAGFEFNDKHISADIPTQNQINTLNVIANLYNQISRLPDMPTSVLNPAIALTFSMDFVTADNSILTLSLEDVAGLKTASDSYVTACNTQLSSLMNSLNSASTAEDLNAINLNDGWPS